MLSYNTRKAAAPINEWRTQSRSRCSAHLAQESDCPATDCGWDEVHRSAIKTDCLVCGGTGRIISFKPFPFLAIVVWGADRFAYLAPAPGTELGDCALGIPVASEWLIKQVLESPRSFLTVDGKTLRPTTISPNVVPNVEEGLVVGCNIYTNTNSG